MTFSYDAKDSSGRAVSGIIEAAEARGAAGALREQGLWATRLEPISAASDTSAGGRPQGRRAGAKVEIAPFAVVPLPALAMMYRQLATLLDSGVPIAQAMTTLAQQTHYPRLKALLRECAGEVGGGRTLSSVMERHPNTFTGIQTELIRAGETGGMLDAMATRIADYLEKETEIRRKLKRETLYPKIVLCVAGMVLLLLGFLQAGSQGLLGRLVFAAVVGGTVFAGWWLGRFLNQLPAFGALWDRLKLMLPGTGGIARRYATARFTRALAALYAGGVNLTQAVGAAARACGNRAIGEQILANAGTLDQGESISGTLARSGLLSPMALQMARTGEQTGNLDAMMEKVADYLESEADTKSHQFAVFAGVGALLLAALVVLFIALSFYGGQLTSLMRSTGS